MRRAESDRKPARTPRTPPKGGMKFKDQKVDVSGVEDLRGRNTKTVHVGFEDVKVAPRKVENKRRPTGTATPTMTRSGARAGGKRTSAIAIANRGDKDFGPGPSAKIPPATDYEPKIPTPGKKDVAKAQRKPAPKKTTPKKK